MSKKIGYARVSTKGQNLDSQLDALRKAGVEPDDVFTDKATGTNMDRPGWEACNNYLRKGDTLVVVAIDRIGRSIADLTRLVDDFNNRGIGLVSLREQHIDTTSPHGKLVFNIFSTLAQYENEQRTERIIAGQQAARERGKHIGRFPETKMRIDRYLRLERKAKELELTPYKAFLHLGAEWYGASFSSYAIDKRTYKKHKQ